MRVQLWSYNYDPEPQGIGPLSRTVAQGLAQKGHDLSVVAAHPHYPEEKWGSRLRPYREVRDGLTVLRLPLWVGRESRTERIRQELTFATAQALVAPLLPQADALISVTPSFPALAPALVWSGARRIPWILWIQDMVTVGAATTGLVGEGFTIRAARAFELLTYKAADRIVVISDAFRRKLVAQGVRKEKIVTIFNPATRWAETPVCPPPGDASPRILAMGNIGHSQGLDAIVDRFESSPDLKALRCELVVAGHGVATETVRSRIRSRRVRLAGVLYGQALEPELRRASLGLVSQRPDILEFNLPSKLMTYMACGVPVLASVNPNSETARIVRDSGCGWVVDAAVPEEFAAVAAAKLQDSHALRRAGAAGFEYAKANFSSEAVSTAFDTVLCDVVRRRQAV